MRQICSSVWLAVMKKRIRDLLSGTAGNKIGFASMPSRSSAAATADALRRVAEDDGNHGGAAAGCRRPVRCRRPA